MSPANGLPGEGGDGNTRADDNHQGRTVGGVMELVVVVTVQRKFSCANALHTASNSYSLTGFLSALWSVYTCLDRRLASQ
jgi:hypothetical protein